MELWKDIKGYEGQYQVSSLGEIKNIRTGHILKGSINNAGYRRISFGNSIKKHFVHRIVALHFCDGYEEGLVVNHKDGNKLNNNKDNLEWVTRSQNDLHAFSKNLRKIYPCTYKHKIEKYDLQTNETLQIYDNTDECSKDLGVARSNIYATCNGKQKSCRGFGLRYQQ